MEVGVVNNIRNGPFNFASKFSAQCLLTYMQSPTWYSCGTSGVPVFIQGTVFRPQFLVADLESLKSSHKILASLKSHSGGQELVSREWGSQTGSQKESGNGSGYSALRTGPENRTPPSQCQSPRTIELRSLLGFG